MGLKGMICQGMQRMVIQLLYLLEKAIMVDSIILKEKCEMINISSNPI